jgi:hypothetical protein
MSVLRFRKTASNVRVYRKEALIALLGKKGKRWTITIVKKLAFSELANIQDYTRQAC